MKRVKPRRMVPATQLLPCKFCQRPILQKPGVPRKDFCDNRHRSAYREQEHQAAIQAVDDAIDNLDAAVAELHGARARLTRFARKASRPRKGSGGGAG